jgi:hypothetical protein
MSRDEGQFVGEFLENLTNLDRFSMAVDFLMEDEKDGKILFIA